LLAWIAAVGLVLAISGCAVAGNTSAAPGASATPSANAATPTTIPHPIAAFTCDADSLPVRPANTRKSCSVGTQFGVETVQATYATTAGVQPSVDESDLITSGWQLATAAQGDGVVTSEGYGVYLYQSAWFLFEWTGNSSGSFKLTVQTSVPPGATPIACGKTPPVGSGRLKGIVLPDGAFMISILGNSASFTPVCIDDVQHFYEALLPAAGWHIDQPFGNASYAPGTTQVKSAVISRTGAKATITIAGYPGTQTLILITKR
jgi:hypothetical protein